MRTDADNEDDELEILDAGMLKAAETLRVQITTGDAAGRMAEVSSRVEISSVEKGPRLGGTPTAAVTEALGEEECGSNGD